LGFWFHLRWEDDPLRLPRMRHELLVLSGSERWNWCRISCETVEKGLNSADYPPSNKFLPKDDAVIKVI
jgi:hypothetical protein